MQIRLHARTSLAADLAHEARLKIGEHDVIMPCVRTDRDRVAALMIRAIDQDSFSKAPAGLRRLGKRTSRRGRSEQLRTDNDDRSP